MQDINNKAKIVSISLTQQEKEWLDDMDLSPTALMKQKIGEMMTSSLAQRKRVKELEEVVERLNKRLEKVYQFIESKGLYNELEGYNNVLEK